MSTPPNGGRYDRLRRELRDAGSVTFLVETVAELITAVEQLTVEVRDARREIHALRGHGHGRD